MRVQSYNIDMNTRIRKAFFLCTSWGDHYYVISSIALSGLVIAWRRLRRGLTLPVCGLSPLRGFWLKIILLIINNIITHLQKKCSKIWKVHSYIPIFAVS